MLRVLLLALYAFAAVDNCASTRTHADLVEPLFLTPLIELGVLRVAREKSRVRHEILGSVESYSGYFTVNKTYNSNLFFWYFPAETNPETAPVLLWLEGGPGVSSIFSQFVINGPFTILANESIVTCEHSWQKTHNIIYIDNNVGTGYSFSDNNNIGLFKNQADLSRNILSALMQFFDLFSELRNNEFYVTGEYYAGKYVAHVAEAIKQYNGQAKSKKINLQGLAIGNAYADPINQIDFSEMLYQNGLLDFNGRDQVRGLEDQAKALIKQGKYLQAYDALLLVFDTMGPLAGIPNFANYINLKIDESHSWYYERVQQPDIRRALHVGNKPYDGAVEKVTENWKEDTLRSVAHIYADLLNNYRVLFFSGQLDLIVAYVHLEKFLQNMNWSGAKDYKTAPRKQWKVGDVLAGYSKTSGNLTEVLVRNAGHVVIQDQPEWAFDIINRFTSKKGF